MTRARFTSDLSIDEAILLGEVGFEPIEFVMGSSFFHIGYVLAKWSVNGEMETLTRAMASARRLAMHRIIAQAQQAGADGIVGVRLLVDHKEHHAEFIAMGTAVKVREGAPGSPSAGDRWRVHGQPFTSDLSGQDFWALARAGYRPLGLVMGCCVYHVAHQSLDAWFRTTLENVEMPNFTQALYDAREIAMERLQSEATALGASGVVAMRVEEGSHGWHPHILEMLALGTAIGPTGGAHEHEPVLPVLRAV